MTNNYKIACFIGHRATESDDFQNLEGHLSELEAWLDKTIDYLICERGVRHFICGNDVGVDVLEAKAVLRCKSLHHDVRLEIVVPYEGHNESIAEIVDVEKKADMVSIVSQQQNRFAAYSERDRYMQEKSDVVVGVVPLVDGENKTRSTRRMLLQAGAQGKEIYTREYEKLICNGNP